MARMKVGESLLFLARALEVTGFRNLKELGDAYKEGDASTKAEINRRIAAVKHNPTNSAWSKPQ
jgi:hypothetical protein